MKYIPITVISVLSSSLVMALIVVPIIGTQSYKIRNLFFFFFIPIVLFGIINFITYSFLSKFISIPCLIDFTSLSPSSDNAMGPSIR